MDNKRIDLKKVMLELDNEKKSNKEKNALKVFKSILGSLDKNSYSYNALENEFNEISSILKTTDKVEDLLGVQIIDMLGVIPQDIIDDILQQTTRKDLEKCLFSVCMSVISYLHQEELIQITKGETNG